MKSNLKYIIVLILLLTGIRSNAQCWVSLMVDSIPMDTVEICTGDSVSLQLTGECILVNSDFNNGSIGPGWSYVSPGLLLMSPCDTADEAKCAWFGEGSQVARIMETIDLDLTPGGDVSFDLKYGLQGDPTSCEGPDEMMEGVSFQFSTDHGLTWVDITYFAPNGDFLATNPLVQSPLTYTSTQFTNWDNYTFSVPLQAQTPSTRFRWIQSYCSYFNNHYDDNWGLDNVKVTRVFSQNIQWSLGSNTMGPVVVSPTITTTYSVYILGGSIPPDTLAIDYIVVFVHPIPHTVFAGDMEICTGDSTFLQALGPYSFVWSNGGVNPVVLLNPAVTTLYQITATDDLGCKGIDSVSVLVHPLPIVTTVNDTICVGDLGLISASGGVSYSWSNGETNSYITVQPDYTANYSVTVTDQFGCVNQGISTVTVNPLPSVYLSSDTSICYGDEVTLIAGGGIYYYWSTGSQAQFINISPASSSSYSVSVTDQNECQNSATTLVLVSPDYEARIFAEKDTVCRGAETTLSADGGNSFKWSTGAETPSITVVPPFTSYYAVTVSNDFNGLWCPAEAVFQLNVEECSSVFFPNAFTPKGYNAEFKPVGDFSAVYNYTLQIFDRWGKLLFESHNPERGWNGQMKGEYLPVGVYSFRVFYVRSLIDQSYEKVGSVLLCQ